MVVGGLIWCDFFFLLFHTVHGVFLARILEWVAIPFSSGPHFVRTLYYDPSILVDPAWPIAIELRKPLHHGKAVILEGEDRVYKVYIVLLVIQYGSAQHWPLFKMLVICSSWILCIHLYFLKNIA